VSRPAWREAWCKILTTTRQQNRRLDPHRESWRIADRLRGRRVLTHDARRFVTALGDTPRAWQIARLAARVDTASDEIETLLDELVRHVD
jgi:hypothetical protein